MNPLMGMLMGCMLLSFVGRARSFLRSTRCRRVALSSSSLSTYSPKNVAVVGGGLAGLATVFHLIENDPDIHVTVFDKAVVGTGGASSVAGGLLHPLSPRGKLVHWGIEGLEASGRLIKAAADHGSNVLIRDQLFRLAMNSKQATDLQATAEQLPDLCKWLTYQDLVSEGIIQASAETSSLGALRLHGGCQIVHVPSYLQALWKLCQDKSEQIEWELVEVEDSSDTWRKRLQEYDTVVLSCGNGLFPALLTSDELPIQLVRGQSVELRLPDKEEQLKQGILSGKYMSPLPDKSLVLIGATHEFSSDPMSPEALLADLQDRTREMAPHVWELGTVERITQGTRVQSQRGKYGRLPIVGKVDYQLHSNVWLFTGLSSRGLLYHALYGEMLAQAILEDSEDAALSDKLAEIFWWRKV